MTIFNPHLDSDPKQSSQLHGTNLGRVNGSQNQKTNATPNFPPSVPGEPISNLAMIFTFKRLALVFMPVLLTLITPLSLYVLMTLLDNASKGYGLSCIVISAGITSLAKAQIRKSAPSQKKQLEALQTCDRLFVLLLVSSLMFFRTSVRSVTQGGENARYNLYLASIAFGSRFAVGLFFLSLLVCLRHVSFFGIAQCSIFPLPNNPYEKIFYTLSSFDRILDQILARDDPNTKEIVHSSTKQGAKRYRQPTLVKVIVQIILHGFLGGLFSKTAVVPILVRFDSSQVIIGHVVFTCTLLSCFTFLTTYFMDDEHKYHELSPKFFTSLNSRTIVAELWRQIQRSGIIFYWLTIPILSLVGAIWIYGEMIGDARSILCAMCVVYPTTLIMAVYMLATDIILRILLLQPGLSVDKFVAHNMGVSSMDGHSISVEDSIVESILGGFGVALVEKVICPRLIVGKDGKLSQPSDFKKRVFSAGKMQDIGRSYDLEQEEISRNDAMTSILANIIAKGGVCGCRSFEIDLLTLAFLESLGGESKPDPDRDFPLGLSRRHYSNLQRRLAEYDPTKGQLTQPPIVPVLRAICAYMGAIGTSSLVIPPCVPIASQYAIRASCRVIVMNMIVSDASGGSKKRYNHISLMLPVVLQSIYRLRCGIVDYVRHKYERDNTVINPIVDNSINLSNNINARTIQDAGTFESYLAVNYTSLSHLLACCDDNASMVVKALQEVDGTKDLESISKTSIKCQEWLSAI